MDTVTGLPKLQIPNANKKKGRKNNLCWKLAEKHPQHITHYLKLRSKQCTPVLARINRPPMSHWKNNRTRRQFFIYYATLLIPFYPGSEEVVGTHSAQKYFAPQKFCQLMKQWSNPNSSACIVLVTIRC
jgi:hypothetical protein